jgi:hypothetical protein
VGCLQTGVRTFTTERAAYARAVAHFADEIE